MFDTDICGICRDTLIEKKVLRCNHVFHTECIDMWAEKCNQCPYCRQPVYQFEKVQHEFIQMDPDNPFFLSDTDGSSNEEVSDDDLSVVTETSISDMEELLSTTDGETTDDDLLDGDLIRMHSNEQFGNDMITFITVDWHYISQHDVLDESLIDMYFRFSLMKRRWNPSADRIVRNISMYQELSETIITKYINYFDMDILMDHQPVFRMPLDDPLSSTDL